MGDRTLFYAAIPGGVAIASEEQALLAHPGVRSTLDEETLARHFAIEAPRAGTTFFSAIRELPPGSLLHASGGQFRLETFWTPVPPDPIRYRRDDEYAEHLASLLGDAVEARLRSSTPVGVSLSGGMDSPSVAALAVERLGRAGNGSRLDSFSWVFDDLPECDERRWIDPLVASLGLDSTRVVADPYWPLRDAASWPLNPNTPLSNAYRTLKQALYVAVAERGIRTLLIGVFSDRLFVGRETWLASRVMGGHLGDPFRHLARLAAGGEIRGVWRDPALRALARRLAPFLSRNVPPATKPPWLTPAAWKLVESGQAGRAPVPREIRARRTAAVFDDLRGMFPGEIYFASQYSLDVRDPFRDLRVVLFMLAVPPDQLERGPVQKYILRRAMKGRLPDAIVERTETTPLDPLYRRSLFGREAATVERLLRAPDALWRGRVEEEWLLGGFPEKFQAMPDGRGLLVPYFAASAELWSQARRGDPYSRPE
jgi:asparagine synthase (glutamine-hydrolysing)